MKVFVAGATGVIGRRVIPFLVNAGHETTAVCRTPEQRAELERSGVSAVDVSLFDPAALRASVAGHDAVINLATHIPSSSIKMLFRGAWAENDRVRRKGSANLVDAAIAGGVTRFVQESFGPVYPDKGARWIDESVTIRPPPYSLTVVDAEQSAERFTSGVRSGVVLRFGAFYGPDARHLADLIRLVGRGWAPLPGSAAAFLSSISHDDAASAVMTALCLPAGTYNVVDDEPVSHRAYVDSLAEALGVPSPRLPPSWATSLFGGPGRLLARSLRISNRKLRAASEWRPRDRSVREGWPAAVTAWRRSGVGAHASASAT